MQMAQDIDVTYSDLDQRRQGQPQPEITRNQLIAMRKIEQPLCGAMREAGALMGEEDGFLQPTRYSRRAMRSGAFAPN